ncbi:Fuc2NAc and GlcNAc transferase [Desulfonatronum thiosulfatophilum]|uniref:Fuc2NAc and GlcNAc transferase n=1 Tax=Desulfonatronum thiosulfatophilum TaxID=617002 RepID=A0A1G6EAF2_9BACT|nr:glycosyltransferase family 4 protein [Desulfonatronum thiosulfatophilum]SDB54322.1 Fuc2NAc and GlcNAc transferase [Desulfonatronum thiosulfatophilum]
MNVTGIVLIGAAFCTAFLFTGWMRRFALTQNLLDIPNARSSHQLPTPRGGGVSIVLVVLAGLSVLWWHNSLSGAELTAFLGAGGLVALVGWMDDRGHVAARWRLLVHFSAGIWGLAWLGGFPPLELAGRVVDLGWLGHGLAVLYLAWLLNLYNFMDGIDGIAGIEAITVCGGGVVLYWLSLGRELSGYTAPAQPALLLAAATAGFLCWNFPRARIFMGDAGSGFVGLLLGLLSLQAARAAPELFLGWLILLGVFVVDATVTLLRRMLRGERVYDAHRDHAYQHAARHHGSHFPVTLAVGAVNLAWLLPLAGLVATGRLDGLVGLLIAWIPLVIVVVYYRGGIRLDGKPEGF